MNAGVWIGIGITVVIFVVVLWSIIETIRRSK